MKLLVFLLVFTITLMSSCKKCYNCHNQCWHCTNASPDTLCSTNYASKAQFEALLHDLQIYGSVCTQISSSKQKDICDAEAERVLDQRDFYCTPK